MKKYISIFLLVLFLIVLGTGDSKAVLQSNGNTAVTYNVSQWMTNVRKMEEVGGAMGLEETLNSNLTASSKSNNIDVHMQKNTEYGALAILSASSYGNPNKIESGKTTTGNITGVVMALTNEWVAAGTISHATNYYNAVSRYKNLQNASYVRQSGDAITETNGWHGSTGNYWLIHAGYYGGYNRDYVTRLAGLLRSGSGSIFSYNGHCGKGSGQTWAKNGAAHWSSLWYSRAVVVIGEGL